MTLQNMVSEVDRFTNMANNDGKPNEELLEHSEFSGHSGNKNDKMNQTQPVQQKNTMSIGKDSMRDKQFKLLLIAKHKGTMHGSSNRINQTMMYGDNFQSLQRIHDNSISEFGDFERKRGETEVLKKYNTLTSS